jgi:hypothetical protein
VKKRIIRAISNDFNKSNSLKLAWSTAAHRQFLFHQREYF